MSFPSVAGRLQRPLNILIVDDSAMTRAMLKRVTQLSGVPIAQILEAGSAREALAVLECEPVDVLFTDIDMPEMSGADLLREVNSRAACDHILRIVISSDGSTARRAELGELKVRGSVEKPFRPEMVREVLGELIGAVSWTIGSRRADRHRGPVGLV